MEADKHFFLEGLFVIGFSITVAFFFVWLGRSGNNDDVLYRIHFAESVSGLSIGDPVKYLGVPIGTVKALAIDKDDPSRVEVDVSLQKDTPIKTDTKATLKLKGITGVFFIEFSGSTAKAKTLVSVTPAGEVPEIPSAKSSLNTAMDELPKIMAKFSAIEDETKKTVSEVHAVVTKVKENPSLLLRRPKNKKPDEQPDKGK